MGAESDQIVSAGASGNAGGIIVSIGISLGTSGLENLGIRGRLARLRAPEATRAAVPRRVESRASTFASHHFIPRFNLQPDGAHRVQVANAPGVAAFPRAFKRGYRHGYVVPVHKAHVVEILLLAQCDLRQSRGRGAAEAVAEKGAAAVTSRAAAASRGVEGAAVAAPETSRPEGRETHGVGLVGRKLEAAAG